MGGFISLAGYLLAPTIAWFIAHIAKSIVSHRKGEKWSWYRSGSMPSAHTATAAALVATIGVRDGVGSPIFALGVMFVLVVAYDAVMVRRAAGEQGKALQKLLAKSPFAKDSLPHHADGHLPSEVAAGAVLGLVVGWLVAIFITF